MSDIAARDRAADHNIHPDLAKELRAIAAVPMDLRRPALRRLAAKIGNAAMVDLFGEFIGLANQVAFNACEQAKDLLVLQGHVWPHEAERINMPCILGALNGIALSASVAPGPLCGGCAFRAGTVANQCLPTTEDADYCSTPGERPFLCHEAVDEHGNAISACRGFAQRRAALNAAERSTEHQEPAE
ncbi:hypothetical protein [Stenotrophomonas maltophilia]|uniref:Uncharacterized protein n=1 Tax=Stenotrophomonas maltophilia TaxID=40324 RepID=A0A2W6IHK9_STEMA|nr:hypothetical protein [Stenotrophomonas maltophilia]PZS93756.1 hypothetical protein A7X83_05355 [Stenotrophomonas maltophilia]